MNRSFDIQFPVLIDPADTDSGAERSFYYPRRDMLCLCCRGQGQVQHHYCERCNGTGRTYIPRRITVSLPDGVHDQVRLRIGGEGTLSPDGSCWGDLYLTCYLRTTSSVDSLILDSRTIL